MPDLEVKLCTERQPGSSTGVNAAGITGLRSLKVTSDNFGSIGNTGISFPDVVHVDSLQVIDAIVFTIVINILKTAE